jgi:hypothetical protein
LPALKGRNKFSFSANGLLFLLKIKSKKIKQDTDGFITDALPESLPKRVLCNQVIHCYA